MMALNLKTNHTFTVLFKGGRLTIFIGLNCNRKFWVRRQFTFHSLYRNFVYSVYQQFVKQLMLVYTGCLAQIQIV